MNPKSQPIPFKPRNRGVGGLLYAFSSYFLQRKRGHRRMWSIRGFFIGGGQAIAEYDYVGWLDIRS